MTSELKKTWKGVQESIIRQIISRMKESKMKHRELCREMGISPSYWSEIVHLKKPITLEILVAVGEVTGLEFFNHGTI